LFSFLLKGTFSSQMQQEPMQAYKFRHNRILPRVQENFFKFLTVGSSVRKCLGRRLESWKVILCNLVNKFLWGVGTYYLRRHIPDDDILRSHCHEKLIFHIPENVLTKTHFPLGAEKSQSVQWPSYRVDNRGTVGRSLNDFRSQPNSPSRGTDCKPAGKWTYPLTSFIIELKNKRNSTSTRWLHGLHSDYFSHTSIFLSFGAKLHRGFLTTSILPRKIISPSFALVWF
jgi:hypothetical protein